MALLPLSMQIEQQLENLRVLRLAAAAQLEPKARAVEALQPAAESLHVRECVRVGWHWEQAFR